MFASLFQPGVSSARALLKLAYCFSPLIEETSNNTLVLDVTGLEWRFQTYRELANAIALQASNAGLTIQLALANDADTAIHLARHSLKTPCVASGNEQTALSRLPLTRIDPSLAGIETEVAEELLETLTLWGLRTFGDLAGLPEKGVAERLGQAGVKLQLLARGAGNRPLVARAIKPSFIYKVELDHHLKELEPLSFVLSGQLHQLCASLESLAMATNQVRCQLTLAGKDALARAIKLPRPMRDHKTLLKLLLLNIENDPPNAPVKAVCVSCDPVKPQTQQHGLFEPLAPQPDALEITLARISNLVGAGNLGFAEALDTHRPDAFAIKPFVVTPNRETPEQLKPLQVALRRFRPPLAADVQSIDEQPRRVVVNNSARKVKGTVVKLAGPWRSTGDWWGDELWARDEWDVWLRDSANTETVCRLVRELRSGKWYVEGVYD